MPARNGTGGRGVAAWNYCQPSGRDGCPACTSGGWAAGRSPDRAGRSPDRPEPALAVRVGRDAGVDRARRANRVRRRRDVAPDRAGRGRRQQRRDRDAEHQVHGRGGDLLVERRARAERVHHRDQRDQPDDPAEEHGGLRRAQHQQVEQAGRDQRDQRRHQDVLAGVGVAPGAVAGRGQDRDLERPPADQDADQGDQRRDDGGRHRAGPEPAGVGPKTRSARAIC